MASLSFPCSALWFAPEERAPGHVERLVQPDHEVQVAHQWKILEFDDTASGALPKLAVDHLDGRRSLERRPPRVRVLLGPARTRMLQRKSPFTKDDRRSFEVDPQEVRTLSHYRAPSSGQPGVSRRTSHSSSQPNSSHRSRGMS